MKGWLGRRRFLGHAVLAAAAIPCGAFAAAQAGPRSHLLPDVPEPARESTVAVVRPGEFPTLRDAVTEAVRLAGGLAFIQRGARVLLKPAVNSGNAYPATTDPELVSIVATLVLEAGGEPFLADRTMFLRSMRAAFEKTGMVEAARNARIPWLALDHAATVRIAHPLAAHWPDRTVPLYRAAVDADHVVNLCTPRTHFLAGFTMAMKNCVGVVAGSARPGMHVGTGFRERIAEISLVCRPSLVVLDGRLGFGDGGPDTGDLIRPGFIAVGTDPLAIDAVGLAYMRLSGTNDAIGRGSIWAIPVIRHAVEIGIGASGAERIRLVGLAPDAEAQVRAQMA